MYLDQPKFQFAQSKFQFAQENFQFGTLFQAKFQCAQGFHATVQLGCIKAIFLAESLVSEKITKSQEV